MRNFCETCTWYSPKQTARGDMKYGKCHANPPQVVLSIDKNDFTDEDELDDADVIMNYEWPMVRHNDWCGLYLRSQTVEDDRWETINVKGKRHGKH